VADDLRLDEYLDEWLDRHRAHVRPATHKSYRQVVRAYLRPHLGDRSLVDLDTTMIEAFYTDLLAGGGVRGKPLSVRSVRYTHAVLRRALEDALLDGLVAHNAAANARPPRPQAVLDDLDDDLHVWTAEQARRFLAEVDDDPHRAVWHLALGTGARRAELLGLRWSDVDLDVGQVLIRRALTVVDGVARLLGVKTSRPRTVAIAPSVVDALARERDRQEQARRAAAGWEDRWGLVFTTDTGAPVDPYRLTVAFRERVREASVPVVRLHDLRHTHASLLLATGVPVNVVSARLGHTSIAMTMDVYAHLLPGQDADAVAALDRLLWAQDAEAGDGRTESGSGEAAA
jgi:integrase